MNIGQNGKLPNSRKSTSSGNTCYAIISSYLYQLNLSVNNNFFFFPSIVSIFIRTYIHIYIPAYIACFSNMI